MNTWRRQWHPTPVLLPGKSHGRRSLVGCSPRGRWELDMTQWLHFHFSLSCIGEGNGNPLQYSCLKNPRDRGAWWTAIYGVAQSRTRLKRLSSSSSVNTWLTSPGPSPVFRPGMKSAHKKEALGWGRQNRSPLQHPKCLSSIVLGHSDFLQPCITILPWDSRDVSFEFIVQYALDKFSLWRTQQRDWFLRGVELKRGQEGSRTHTDGLSLPALWPPHSVLKGSFVHLLGEEQRMKLESSIPCWLFPHDSRME